jgi:hypothetical protein
VEVLRVWGNDPFGAKRAQVTATNGSLCATGVAIGTSPVPYRVDYQLTHASTSSRPRTIRYPSATVSIVRPSAPNAARSRAT